MEGKGEGSEFTDLGGLQERTDPSTEKEDRKARELLGKFAMVNSTRAFLTGVGGVVGLAVAIAT